MKIPDFDNVDLAIIAATVIAVTIGFVLAYNHYYTEACTLGGLAITAITGLAGKKSDKLTKEEGEEK